MKKQILAAATVISLFLTFAVMFAQAQSSCGVKISVPFEFIIGDEALPAGTYTIRRSSSNRPNVLAIKSADGSIANVFITQLIEDRNPQAVMIIFNKYGENHFLSQVWPASSIHGRQLNKWSRELEMETRARDSQESLQLQKVILTEREFDVRN